MTKTDFAFKVLTISRKNFLGLLAPFSTEQLNKIPQGFNNNLVWNFGHIIVTHQLLCYKLSGLEMYVNDQLVNKYRKGTKPEEYIGNDEIKFLKEMSTDLISKFEKDYAAGLFMNYKSYPTSYGVTLENIDDALAFNNVHEGMHLGTVFALRKLV